MINIDWFLDTPIDFEYKNYILLSYLKSLDESYSIHKLSPFLLYTEKLINELNNFKLRKIEFEKQLQKNIINFESGKIMLEKSTIPKIDSIEIITEIVDYSKPILESKVKLGYKLLDKYPQILF